MAVLLAMKPSGTGKYYDRGHLGQGVIFETLTGEANKFNHLMLPFYGTFAGIIYVYRYDDKKGRYSVYASSIKE